MIKKIGNRVIYANDKVKANREALKAELNKHKGKSIVSLTKKEIEEALIVFLRSMDMLDDKDAIK